MSYEGYEQRLCARGHLTEASAYLDYCGEGDDPVTCPHNDCQSKMVFHHSVDETNGIEYDKNGVPYPHTVEYPFEDAGFESIWHTDHFGTKYATKRLLYKIPT